jgi:predicted RNA-binding Zn ribbon-like protein
VVEEAVALRAAVFGVFAATAAGATPAQPDLAAVRDGYAAAVRAARLVPAGNGLGWSWRGPAMEPLARPLWPVAASAAELATSPDRLRRVKRRAGDGCDVLFVDSTRNRSRRWCLMRYCGNVGKSRRQASRRRMTRAQARKGSGWGPADTTVSTEAGGPEGRR